MSAVNYSRVALAACAASLVLPLAACGTDKDSSSASQSSVQKASTETASPSSSCPTSAPAADTAPEWTLDGTTGSVAVAMTSADGYPKGQPRAGIEPGDTLVFAIKILDAS